MDHLLPKIQDKKQTNKKRQKYKVGRHQENKGDNIN